VGSEMCIRDRLQATLLVTLFCSGLLLRLDADNKVVPCWPRPDVEFGHRLCRAFETYLLIYDSPSLSFEWAWNLLHSIAYNDELFLAECAACQCLYVQDAYALDHKTCPACEIETRRHKRPSIHFYAGT